MDYTNPAYVPDEDGQDAASTDDLPPIPKRDYPMDDDTIPTHPHFLPEGAQLPPMGTDPNGLTDPTGPTHPLDSSDTFDFSAHLLPGTEPLFGPLGGENDGMLDAAEGGPSDPPPRAKTTRNHVGFKEVDEVIGGRSPGDEEDDGTTTDVDENGFPQE
jgi:hypothetical protein